MWPKACQQTTRAVSICVMVIVQPFLGSVKQYIEAAPFAGRSFALPERCPECGAVDSLIRWGTYTRWVCQGPVAHRIRVQRIFCQACRRTHSLPPDFVHPYRHYTTDLLQRTIFLYLVAGIGWRRLLQQLPGLPRSTARAWVEAFAWGAERLLEAVTGQVMQLAPWSEPVAPTLPAHLARIPDESKRRRLERAFQFWLLAEHLYAQVKARAVRLHFQVEQLFRFLLHWLQSLARPPRLVYVPAPWPASNGPS